MVTVIDLDTQDVILTFTAHGRRVAYTRHELLEALGPQQYEEVVSDALTQHALGRSLAHLLVAVQEGRAADLEGQLRRLLARFDGRVSPTPSRIPHTLEALADAAPNVRGVVDQFLSRYPLKGRGKKK